MKNKEEREKMYIGMRKCTLVAMECRQRMDAADYSFPTVRRSCEGLELILKMVV